MTTRETRKQQRAEFAEARDAGLRRRHAERLRRRGWTGAPERSAGATFDLTGSKYRCPEHHDQPVTWRGTGCADCTPTKETGELR